MPLQQYIINDIKPLNIHDKVSDFKLLFNELTYSHIPVENDGIYLGCVSETDVHCFDNSKEISEFNYAIEGFFVRQKTNWLDVLESFTKNNTNLMPVLAEADNAYLGYLEIGDVLSFLSETPFMVFY